MHESSDISAVELAEQISGPAHYKFDHLVEGIRIEQERLRNRSHLLVLWHQELDYDGLTDWVFFEDGFDTVDAARHAAVHLLSDLRDAYTSLTFQHHKPFREDPTRQGLAMPKYPRDHAIHVQDERTLYLTADGYHRHTFRTRVLGPFIGSIIAPPLFEALSDSRQELWSFFADVGESSTAGKSRRSPLPSSTS